MFKVGQFVNMAHLGGLVLVLDAKREFIRPIDYVVGVEEGADCIGGWRLRETDIVLFSCNNNPNTYHDWKPANVTVDAFGKWLALRLPIFPMKGHSVLLKVLNGQADLEYLSLSPEEGSLLLDNLESFNLAES